MANWDHQPRAIAAVGMSFRRGNKRVVMQSPVGSGKTRMAGTMARRYIETGRRVAFFVDSLPLLAQAAEAFTRLDLPVGIIQATTPGDPDAALQVVSQATYTRRSVPLFPDLIFIDECHYFFHCYRRLAVEWPNARIIGLSASPWRHALGQYFADNIVVAQHHEMIASGVSVPSITYCPSKIDIQKLGKKITMEGPAYTGQDAQVKKVQYVGNIVDTWLSMASDRQSFVSAYDVAHSQQIVEEFKRRGVSAAHIDGYNPEAASEIIAEYKRGGIAVLSCTRMISKGFDHPPSSCLMFAHRIKSLSLWYQWCGRVSRASPGKTNALHLDFAGNCYEHGYDLNTDDLPTTLSDAEAGDKKEILKREKQAKHCPSCNPAPQLTGGKCPQCGFSARRRTAAIGVQGELELHKKTSVAMREKNKKEIQWYAWLKWVGEKKGYSEKWALAKFKTQMKDWPKFQYRSVPARKPPEFFLTKVVKMGELIDVE